MKQCALLQEAICYQIKRIVDGQTNKSSNVK
jgi:hypothetical protein